MPLHVPCHAISRYATTCYETVVTWSLLQIAIMMQDLALQKANGHICVISTQRPRTPGAYPETLGAGKAQALPTFRAVEKR